MANDKAQNPHEGHRDRMRARFDKEGGDNFETYQLLEMYLFPLLPRRDTNEIAHRLITRFGSLEGVFLASAEDLVQVEGISTKTAGMICLTAALFRRMARESYHPPKKYRCFRDIVDYLLTLYTGITVEQVYLLLFDNGMRMLDCVMIDEGTVNQANIILRKIVEHAVKRNASSVLLAHNHPGGDATPSSEDVGTTNHLYHSLQAFGVTLIDHAVVGENTVIPILNYNYGNLRPSPVTGEMDKMFYHDFYGKFGLLEEEREKILQQSLDEYYAKVTGKKDTGKKNSKK